VNNSTQKKAETITVLITAECSSVVYVYISCTY